MKIARNIILWIIGIVGFCFLMNWAAEGDKSYCEEYIANKLHSTAVYVGGQCMVKGYGRWGG